MRFKLRAFFILWSLSFFLIQCSSVQDTSKKQTNYSNYDDDLSDVLSEFDSPQPSAESSLEKELSKEESLAFTESAVGEGEEKSAKEGTPLSLEEEFEKELLAEEMSSSGDDQHASVDSEDDLAALFEKEIAQQEAQNSSDKSLEEEFESIESADGQVLSDTSDAKEPPLVEELADLDEAQGEKDSSEEEEVASTDSATGVTGDSNVAEGEAQNAGPEKLVEAQSASLEDKDFEDVTPEAEEEASFVKVSETGKTWVPVKKIQTTPFRKSGVLANSVYLARPQDTLGSVAEKIYGDLSKKKLLLTLNPHFRGKTLKVGDKVYYNSPMRPTDSSRVLTYYEELGLSPQSYIAKSGDNIRVLSKKFLGDSGSWKEVWAYNLQIESKGELPAGSTFRYWDRSAHQISLYERTTGAINSTTLASKATDTGQNRSSTTVSQPSLQQESQEEQAFQEAHNEEESFPQREISDENSAPESHIDSEAMVAHESPSQRPQEVELQEASMATVESPQQEASLDQQRRVEDSHRKALPETPLASSDKPVPVKASQNSIIDYVSYGAIGFAVLGLFLVISRRRKKNKRKETFPKQASPNSQHDMETQVTRVV